MPNDTNIANTVNENIKNYSDFKVDVARFFGMRKGNVNVILVLIGALKSISLKLCDFHKQLWIRYQLVIQNHFVHCTYLEERVVYLRFMLKLDL